MGSVKRIISWKALRSNPQPTIHPFTEMQQKMYLSFIHFEPIQEEVLMDHLSFLNRLECLFERLKSLDRFFYLDQGDIFLLADPGE